MREILFRGKRIDNGKWIEGYYSKTTLIGEKGSYVGSVIATVCNEVYEGAWEEVDPKTVGQFTGLFDKNGQRIFEGDVLLFNKGRNLPGAVPVPEVVKFHQGDCAFQRFPGGYCITKGGAGKLLQPDMMSECEVVGNIYDEN